MSHTTVLEGWISSAIDAETEARAALAAKLTGSTGITATDMGTVLTAAADAKPWRDVLRISQTEGLADAVLTVRDRACTALLEYGENQSTSALMNEGERLKREALRGFLRRTEVFAELVAQEHAEEPSAEKAPAASVVPAVAAGPVARPTKAQMAVLAAIDGGGVTIRHGRANSRMTASCPTGSLNIGVLQRCLDNGWAERDNSTPLYVGQAVSLTDAGLAQRPA